MSPQELALHARKKIYQKQDARGLPDFSGLDLSADRRFPVLPDPAQAPGELIDALARDAEKILSGEWLAFGHLPLRMDDPPRWQYDYFAGKDFQTNKSAFKLDHRAQPGGADIKVIWEPNRWCQLVRLAQAAWLLKGRSEELSRRAAEKCIQWLHDWAKTNRPYTGLNWTSGLETGIRLMQFAWIDGLLGAAGVEQKLLTELRQEIIPPHLWFTWRYRSFGSSANNHLLGELAGVILALARYPGLEKISVPLREVRPMLEEEVLAQFASDGGNREQALGYHLFSWEFCWQSVIALESAGWPVSAEVKDRLSKAAMFYAAVKQPNSPWDFGDSDDAWVTPLFAKEQNAAEEWRKYFVQPSQSPPIDFWFGKAVSGILKKAETGGVGWQFFPESGYALFRAQNWLLRWDLSPLGYLSMAPHGHLDALHVSIWFRGEPVIIDPGTGAYYADKEVRTYLADWAAHNGPRLLRPPRAFPERRGTFLWSSHHPIPRFKQISEMSGQAEIDLGYARFQRTTTYSAERDSFVIEDSTFGRAGDAKQATTWKFPPLALVQNKNAEVISVTIKDIRLNLKLSGWQIDSIYNPTDPLRNKVVYQRSDFGEAIPITSLCSPRFRALQVGPFIDLSCIKPGKASIEIVAS